MAQIRAIISIILLPIIALNKCSVEAAAHTQTNLREISHEDIRDAILSLINIFRDNKDKLERHEARERQLADHLKKSLFEVDRKQRTEESNMVTVLDTLNIINRRLEILENATYQGFLCKDHTGNLNPSNNVQQLVPKLISIEQSIKNNDDILQGIKQSIDVKLDSIAQNVQQTQNTIQQQLAHLIVSQKQKDTDLNVKVDSKLAHFQITLEKLDKILELQNTSVQQTATLINNGHTNGLISFTDQLTKSTDQQLLHIKEGIEKGVDLLKEKIGHVEQTLIEKQENVQNGILKAAKANDDLRTDMAKSYDQLLAEIKGFSKMDQILVQTADNVLDAKRRVEYGTHQILLEVGELIKTLSKDTNETINNRFDIITNEIVTNQDGVLKNLSTKIEKEISLVWRQIGIMYETLTSSADALNKLQLQTEIYVNGSAEKMDSMQGKVGQITSRMGEVDDNLNYLLGRLSLVTQEFNQIKIGLGEALDKIRSSFHTVQEKVKDSGPGPNPIDDDLSTPDSQLLKTKYDVQ